MNEKIQEQLNKAKGFVSEHKKELAICGISALGGAFISRKYYKGLLKSTYTQGRNQGLHDAIYQTCVAMDHMERSNPGFRRKWFEALNNTPELKGEIVIK